MEIGFIGINRKQTNDNFKSFININFDDVKSIDSKNHEAIMSDDTHIFCIYAGQLPKRKVDQIILSDDSRMNINLVLNNFNYEFTNLVPKEFRVMIDNIDEV